MDHLYNLLFDSSYFLDLFLNLCSQHRLFFDDLHFMDLLSNVRHNLLNLLYLLLNNWFFFDLCDFFHSCHLLDYFHYLFHLNRDLHYSFYLLFHQDQLLDDFIAGNWKLERNDHGLFHLNDFLYLDCMRDDLFYGDFFGDFYP